jgi:hypothetical protein
MFTGFLYIRLRGNDIAPVALADTSHGHADAQEQRLLYDEHEDGRDEEARKATLRVKERHLFEVDRHTAYLILLFGGVVHITAYLHILYLLEGGEVRAQDDAFIVQHTAHVAVHADIALVAAGDVLGEGAWYADDAVGVALLHQVACLAHIGAVRDNLYVGGGIDITEELAAEIRVVLVDDSDRHVAHHLIGIYIRVEERVEEGYEEDEDEHTAVVKDVGELVATNL